MNKTEATGDAPPASLPASTAQDTALQLFVQSIVHGVDRTAKETDSRSAAQPVNAGQSDKPVPLNSASTEKGSPDSRAQDYLPSFSIVGGDSGRGGAGGPKDDRRGNTPVGDFKPAPRTSDQAQIDPDHFNYAAKKVIAKIDTDGSGLISKDQLAKALQDQSFKGEDAQALVALYRNFDDLKDLSLLHWTDSNNISAGDLDRYQLIEHVRSELRTDSAVMKDWAHKNLAKYTAASGGFLTEDVIDKALKDKNTPETDRRVLELIKKHFDNWEPMPYVNALVEQSFDIKDNDLWHDRIADIMSGVWSSCHAVAADGQKAGTAYDLYGGKDPLDAINPEAVRQGSIGDCYFESVVAAIAKSNPASIRDMIKDNKDGTYTVEFPEYKGLPITVKAPTEAELGFYNRGSSHGTWASVLEKAYGKLRNLFNFWDPSDTPQGAADGGGYADKVFKLFTDKDPSFDQIEDVNQADLAKKLEAAVANHKGVTAGINRDNDWMVLFHLDTPKTADQFYKWHEYTITGFIPDGHGSGKVEIRNPWGGAKDSPDGTIRISLEKFMHNFSDLTVQS